MIDLATAYGVDHALRLGYLKPGDQLPKVWDVVASLAINPNTVLKAYRELETNGLAVGRPGQGTFIEATLNQVALPELSGLRRSQLSWLTSPAAAGRAEIRRAWRERHRSQRPGHALRQRLGIAQVRAGDSRRARGRPGRSERRRQDHLDMVLCLPSVAVRSGPPGLGQ